jgi:hypothetical protein
MNPGLLTDASLLGEGMPADSANAVDKPGPNSIPSFSHRAAREAIPASLNGDRGFNRSSTPMGFASPVPVEKSGPDFHRLAAPTCPKSPIRSIPKYGSGAIRSTIGQV